MLPNGERRSKTAQPSGTIDDFIGCLAGQTKKVATIEEMNEVIAAGWAGEQCSCSSGVTKLLNCLID